MVRPAMILTVDVDEPEVPLPGKPTPITPSAVIIAFLNAVDGSR